MGGCISLHGLIWDKESPVDADIIAFGERLKDVVAGARKYKSENFLSMKAEMPELIIGAEEKFNKWFVRSMKDIQACCRAKVINFRKAD